MKRKKKTKWKRIIADKIVSALVFLSILTIISITYTTITSPPSYTENVPQTTTTPAEYILAILMIIGIIILTALIIWFFYNGYCMGAK